MQSIYGERVRFDGLEVRLGAFLDDTATLMVFDAALTHAGGLAVPDIGQSGPEYVPLSILDVNNRLSEIVYLIGYVKGSGSGRIVRAMEGTNRKEHSVGAKVVHAGTVADYVSVLDHEKSPQAHAAAIEAAAQDVMKGHLTDHTQDPLVDPHPVYIRKDDGVLNTVVVANTLVVRPNAQLIVEGDLVIEGRLIVNGYEIRVGPARPANIPDDLIWIETVS